MGNVGEQVLKTLTTFGLVGRQRKGIQGGRDDLKVWKQNLKDTFKQLLIESFPDIRRLMGEMIGNLVEARWWKALNLNVAFTLREFGSLYERPESEKTKVEGIRRLLILHVPSEESC